MTHLISGNRVSWRRARCTRVIVQFSLDGVIKTEAGTRIRHGAREESIVSIRSRRLFSFFFFLILAKNATLKCNETLERGDTSLLNLSKDGNDRGKKRKGNESLTIDRSSLVPMVVYLNKKKRNEKSRDANAVWPYFKVQV